LASGDDGDVRGLRAPFALVGVRVWAGPERGEAGDAIAFGASGRVAAVGARADVRAALPPGAPVLAPGAHWVVPGFVDAHAHVRATATARLAYDVSDAIDVAAVLHAVRRAAAATPAGGWVSLWGLQPEALRDARPPTRAELDAAAPRQPVRIRHRSAHAWVLNTAAVDRVALWPSDLASLPDGVEVERDADGSPTGLVVDHAGWLGQVLGRVSPADQLAAAASAWSTQLERQGVVALVDATASNGRDQLATLAQWRTDGIIAQHLAVMTATDVSAAPSPLTFVGHKLMPPFGGRDLGEVLSASWRRGIGVAVHCADTETLGDLITAVDTIPPAARGPLRIEHASVCPPEWISRVAAIGAAVVTHPAFVSAHGDRYLRAADLRPHDWLYRLASWVRAGVTLAVASDTPAGPAEPLAMWRAALTRRTASGAVINAGEVLTGEAALSAMTGWAADCSGLAAAGYGRLAPGGPGAAVVLDGDPFLPPPGSEPAVLAVIREGNVVS